MPYLFIDFGASRVKTAVFKDNKYIQIKDFTPVVKEPGPDHYYEIAPHKIQNLFQEIINTYKKFSIKKIFICSEMHGFALRDDNDIFLTNYISWQDNRSADSVENISTYDWAHQKLPSFREKTGMYIKYGIAAINLLHLLRTQNFPRKIKIISLPEIITGSKIHNTMLAGLGIWDIYQNQPYEDFFKLCSQLGYEIITNIPSSFIEITGYINDIPIYTAVGDNQCAILGSNLKENDIILNLGTGSQIAHISNLNPHSPMEQRPYFNKKKLSIITHIPSGRALNQFIGFIQECLNTASSCKNAWDLFHRINLESLETSTLDINLAVFKDAYYKYERDYRERYRGSILNIKENSFTLQTYCSSLLRCYIDQYINIIEDLQLNYNHIVLAGGIPQKIPLIKEYLKKNLNTNIIQSTNSIDETFEGLKKITKLIK